MLSRRSFTKLCGISTIPLFTGIGTETAAETDVVLGADRFVTFCNLRMPEVAQVFTKTDQLEFPLDFLGGEKGDSVHLIPYMIQQTISYNSKYKKRPDVINRTAEILAKDLAKTIEADMLHLLFTAGAESRAVFGYKKSHILSTDSPFHKFIISPETLDERFAFPQPVSDRIICSHLLGKGQSFQSHIADLAGLKFEGDIGIRVRSDRPHNMVLTHLPHLPPLMGFNISFEFDAKTQRVTHFSSKKEGVELISIAYFAAMSVLDSREILLLDIES